MCVAQKPVVFVQDLVAAFEKFIYVPYTIL